MTAIFTSAQVDKANEARDAAAPACVSVFAGRLASFGIDDRPFVRDAAARVWKTGSVKIIWASTREVFNVLEADEIDCHIIAAPVDILKSSRRSAPKRAPNCRSTRSRRSAPTPSRLV